MQIRVLELQQYVEKFLERPRAGCRYVAEGNVIYRERAGNSEDIGELDEPLEAVDLPAVDFDGGEYIGDAEAIAHLRSLARSLRLLVEEIETVLRS